RRPDARPGTDAARAARVERAEVEHLALQGGQRALTTAEARLRTRRVARGIRPARPDARSHPSRPGGRDRRPAAARTTAVDGLPVDPRPVAEAGTRSRGDVPLLRTDRAVEAPIKQALG